MLLQHRKRLSEVTLFINNEATVQIPHWRGVLTFSRNAQVV